MACHGGQRRSVGAASHQPHTPRGLCEATPSQVGRMAPSRSRRVPAAAPCGVHAGGHPTRSKHPPNRTTACIARCPRALETLEQPHTSTPRTSCDRVCLPCCDHSCPTPAAHTLALRWLCAGRIIQGGNHGEGNRGATTHHHSAETKRSCSLTSKPRILHRTHPRGEGGALHRRETLTAPSPGRHPRWFFSPRRDGSDLERRC